MKNLFFVFAFATFLFSLTSCDKSDDIDCICNEIFAPVCGSDGTQYSNSCFAECAGVAYTQGECPIETQALVVWLGEPSLDGCGWMINLDVDGINHDWYPDALADEFKVDSLAVDISYQMTSDSSFCGLDPTKIPVIELVEISAQ